MEFQRLAVSGEFLYTIKIKYSISKKDVEH